jgi:hypothetical protein
MDDSHELEIELDSLDAQNYRVTLRFTRDVAALGVPREVGPENVQIDRTALRENLQNHDFDTYGRLLRDAIFRPPAIHALFAEACAARPLRVKLKLDPTDWELHSLRWEMLTAVDDTVLSSREDVAISRYLASGREVSLRREPDELRALIVVANPSPKDSENYGLSAIDVDYSRRAASLSPIRCESFTSDDSPVTMNRLITRLKDGVDQFGGYDILYLVCHGAMVRGGNHPLLLLDLETDAEKNNPSYFRSGKVLVQRLAEELSVLPRLVVLASCASAGSDDGNALAALGPLMARAGIPAVIAMQGYVRVQTVEALIPVFFRSLMEHGEVDRAMREARSHVKNGQNYDDWWMPVLFMRLATGRIWYTPGFDVQVADEEDLWSRVISNIVPYPDDVPPRSYCTPILGAGVAQHLFGSDTSLASRWAREHNYPLAPYDQDHLPQVMQYLKVRRLGEAQVRRQYLSQLGEQLRRRYPDLLGNSDRGLEQMVTLLWEEELKNDHNEPHNILARLPFTCYVTTNPTSVLEIALRHQGREPQVEIYNWRQLRARERAREVDIVPTVERPLVFHALGHLHDQRSLVLSEDDYFDYLISFIRSLKSHMSSGVHQALTDASLLFLGFRLFRWDFRMIFRSLLSQAQSGLLDDYPHVAAQLSPSDGAFLNPQAARYYLADYYKGSNPEKIKLDIYWGETSDFLVRLGQKWPEMSSEGSLL